MSDLRPDAPQSAEGKREGDTLSDLLDERRQMIVACADWWRRWESAVAKRYGPEHPPETGVRDLDDAARAYQDRPR